MTILATEPPVNPPEHAHCPSCEKCVSEETLRQMRNSLTFGTKPPYFSPKYALSHVVDTLDKLGEWTDVFNKLAPYGVRIAAMRNAVDMQHAALSDLVRDWPLEICDPSEHVTCRDCAYEG